MFWFDVFVFLLLGLLLYFFWGYFVSAVTWAEDFRDYLLERIYPGIFQMKHPFSRMTSKEGQRSWEMPPEPEVVVSFLADGAGLLADWLGSLARLISNIAAGLFHLIYKVFVNCYYFFLNGRWDWEACEDSDSFLS